MFLPITALHVSAKLPMSELNSLSKTVKFLGGIYSRTLLDDMKAGYFELLFSTQAHKTFKAFPPAICHIEPIVSQGELQHTGDQAGGVPTLA